MLWKPKPLCHVGLRMIMVVGQLNHMPRSSIWKLTHVELDWKELRISYLKFTKWWLNRTDNKKKTDSHCSKKKTIIHKSGISLWLMSSPTFNWQKWREEVWMVICSFFSKSLWLREFLLPAEMFLRTFLVLYAKSISGRSLSALIYAHTTIIFFVLYLTFVGS